MQISTIGLDLAKSIFQVTLLMPPAKWRFARRCDDRRGWRSSRSSRRVWSASRPAARRITGRVSSCGSGMTCG